MQLRTRPPVGEEGEEVGCADGAVASTVSLDLGKRIGQRIGPYRILEILGEGGMGIVCRAEQTEPVRRIVFHYGDSCNIDLGEPADIIISELTGHIAFEEGTIEAIFDARRRFLKSLGIIIPQAVRLVSGRPALAREA